MNYGQANWNSLRVSSTADWLSVRALKLPQSSTETAVEFGPRESWRIVGNIDINLITSGQVENALVNVCIPNAKRQQPHAVIPVSVYRESIVSAYPKQLFFGNVRPGEGVSRRVMLRFAEAAIIPEADSIAIRNDVGKSLTFNWKKSNDRNLELSILFSPSEDSHEGIVKGLIVMEIPSSDQRNTTIDSAAAGAFAKNGRLWPASHTSDLRLSYWRRNTVRLELPILVRVAANP